MANKNLTIFQRLNRLVNGSNEPKQKKQTYYLPNDAVLKTTNKAEYDIAKLEGQQNKYFQNNWKRVEQGLFQHTINYEANRVASYSDYEAMEFFPEIGAALDVMMEESTTLNTDGKIINIYSESKRIKSIVEDLLFNRLDIHTTLPMWVRNMCKYGDNFVLLHLDNKYGIVGARQMPNFEMDRRDVDFLSKDRDNEETIFYWRGGNIEFKSFQIAHFRLLGDDRRLPYGTSILEKARRVWKQLLMCEDAMLVYRITRAPERKVFKIYVGNIDDKDVPAYVNDIADRFKRTIVTDPQTGQLDLRYNQLSNDQDFFIPVRSEDAPSPIDTLPGAQNLDQIADIEYLQKKLFTALRVPKPFLGYEEATGDGKNLALQDIRFARTINRIQQSILQELNQIVIIHLTLLGFEDDLNSFTLTLNNPSKQAEMLNVEHLQAKVTLFKDAVTDLGNGFSVMSMTRAKREILGWSDHEIKDDFLQQRMEKAASGEINRTESVIKHTGIFDEVDRIYGDINAAKNPQTTGGEGEQEDGGPTSLGGGFGGGGVSDSDIDFSDDDTENNDLDTGLDQVESGEEVSDDQSNTAPEENAQDNLSESLMYKKSIITNNINEMINKVDKFLQ